MSNIIKGVRGTADGLPSDSYKWQFIERTLIETARLFGYNEIRIPIFEHTEVFVRGVGETTDVVQKEMYTFEDKGNRSLTLRPEFTAGIARSSLEHGLLNALLPLKVCYTGSCFRYEKPQAGRLREFHQFGVECLGASAASADAEVILLAWSLLSGLGIKNVSLEINSIGCPECRAKYHDELKAYFSAKSDQLCLTCNERLERNPMRILDCKSPVCIEMAKRAPVIIDYLCDDCAEHFETVKKHLKATEISFTVNPHIVRGLDYYTRTVFEFISGEIGAQSTICGGGRYDGLIEEIGGPPMPSLGFAMGLERLLMVIENTNVEIKKPQDIDIFIAAIGENASIEATRLCSLIRGEGFSASCDISGRGLKAQMKYADKIGAEFSCVIGDNEIVNGNCNLKNMKTGETIEVSLPDGLISAIYDFKIDIAMSDLADTASETMDFKI